MRELNQGDASSSRSRHRRCGVRASAGPGRIETSAAILADGWRSKRYLGPRPERMARRAYGPVLFWYRGYGWVLGGGVRWSG